MGNKRFTRGRRRRNAGVLARLNIRLKNSSNSAKRRNYNGNNTNSRDYRTANQGSQAYRREMKRRARRREILINRIKYGTAALIILAVLITGIVRMAGCAISHIKGGSNQADEVVQTLAYVEPSSQEPVKQVITIPQPVKSADYKDITSEKVKSAYISLVDIDSHEIIAGRQYDAKIYPASMTKVMTLIIAVENIRDMNDTFTMTTELIDPLVRENASRAGFDPGEKVTANDLLYGLILPSGADAAQALARMIAGSEEEYAGLMNAKCAEIGLKNTHFANTSGLYDADQYTTPVEMGMIMEYAMQNELCAKVLSTYQYTTAPSPQHPGGIALTSTMFSRMYGTEAEGVTITAGKTGYITESGNCLVSYAVKGDKHYVCVTSGGTNKWDSIFDDIELYGNYLP
mgnify:FL=1